MKLRLTVSIFWCLITSTAWLSAAPDLQILSLTGQSTPDGQGTFASFRTPTLNNGSQAGFRGSALRANSSTYSGVFVARKSIPALLQLAREATLAPDGTSQFFSLLPETAGDHVALNQRGRAFFTGSLQDAFAQTFSAAFAATVSSGSLTEFLRQHQSAGTVEVGGFSIATALAVNNHHQVAVTVPFKGPLVGTTNDSGILRLETTNSSFVPIARKGSLVPGGNGRFSVFTAPNLNNAGEVAFASGLSETANGTYDNQAIYRSDGVSLVLIARTAPTGGFTEIPQITPGLNNAGVIAFRAEIYDDGTYRKVVVCDDGVTTTEIARGGQSIPRTPSTIATIDNGVEINDAGQVAFVASLASPHDEALVRGNGLTLKTIAKLGDDVPGLTNTIASLVNEKYSLNNTGQVVFTTRLSGGQAALLFHDDVLGLVKIAKVGEELLGSTIVELDYNGTSSAAHLPLERNGFNDLGEVAFWFMLADNRQGIALWTKPEPRITDVRLIGGDVVIFASVPTSRSCTWEYTPEMGTPFTPIGTNVFFGSGGLVQTNFTHFGAASPSGQGFYRLRLEP